MSTFQVERSGSNPDICTKNCGSCHKDKSLSCFAFKNKQKDIRQSFCKKCQKEYRKIHYHKNRDKIKEQIYQRRKDLFTKVNEYKSLKGCVECGEKDFRVLDFDHISDKEIEISNMCSNGYGWDSILKEIEKCDVVCANHHRVRTWGRSH